MPRPKFALANQQSRQYDPSAFPAAETHVRMAHYAMIAVVVEAKRQNNVYADMALAQLCALTGRDYHFVGRPGGEVLDVEDRGAFGGIR
jgi:hypothetical protein